MNELGFAIGWIAVVGFGLTIAITLAGLVGLVSIQEHYMRWLFKLVIVELVGMILLSLPKIIAPPEVIFDPPLPPDVYLLDRNASPLTSTDLILGTAVKRSFNKQKNVTLNGSLEFTVNNSDILVKEETTEHTFQFGSINLNKFSRDDIDKIIPVGSHLSLGIHYAQYIPCTAYSDSMDCPKRRNIPLAISHLTSVLESDESNSNYHALATSTLFHLKDQLGSCGQFALLAQSINRHRPVPVKFAELGDLYFAMILYSSDLNFDAMEVTSRLAIKNLTRFLNSPLANPNTELFERVSDQLTALIRRFVSPASPLIADLESGNLQSAVVFADGISDSFECPENN